MNGVFKQVLALGCLIAATAAQADWMAPVVRYECSARQNRLRISYERVEDESAEYKSLIATGSSWDMSDLIIMENTQDALPRRTGTKHVVRKCRLSDGVYNVDIHAVFSGSDRGECGAWQTGSLRITRGRVELYKDTPFEAWCHGDKPIISSVTLRPGAPPHIAYDEDN